MTYIDGFVIPVPSENKDAFIAHAKTFDAWLIEQGALRIVECWGADVPQGKVTDFYGAVKASEDETVAFSWIEWPDKATRDAAYARMEQLMAEDAFGDASNVPFDGKRMIFGGFDPVVELGEKR